MMAKFSCCANTCGAVHVIVGVGAGFLLVNYLGLGDVMVWGWLLVVAGLAAHFFWKMH